MTSDLDILFPMPSGNRNADDMGNPPSEIPRSNTMTTEREALIARLRTETWSGFQAMAMQAADMLEADALNDDLMLVWQKGFADGRRAQQVAVPQPASDYAIHKAHCFQSPYETSCKYGDDDCPMAAPQPPQREPVCPSWQASRKQALDEAADLCDGQKWHAGGKPVAYITAFNEGCADCEAVIRRLK